MAFERVLTSTLVRAAETARLAGFAETEPRLELAEWDYGAYEGRTTIDIPVIRRWNISPETPSPANPKARRT